MENAQKVYWSPEQLLVHLLNLRAAVARDPRTGKAIPQSLHDYLDAVYREVTQAHNPVPEDLLLTCCRLTIDAVKQILRRPHHRLLRNRALVPPHKADEVDTASLMWLARQPGRNTREKLASRNRMLAVEREISLKTAENHLLVRFLREIEPLLSMRLENASDYEDTGDSASRMELLREMHELCADVLSGRELKGVGPSIVVRPNNAMLSDPNYSRIWRSFNMFRNGTSLVMDAEEMLAMAVVETLAAVLVAEHGALMTEDLVVAMSGFGDEALGVLGSADDVNAPAVEHCRCFLMRPIEDADRHSGVIRTISDRGFGFIIPDNANRDLFFHVSMLAGGVRSSDLSEGMQVEYTERPGRQGPEGRDVRPKSLGRILLLAMRQASVSFSSFELRSDCSLRAIGKSTCRITYGKDSFSLALGRFTCECVLSPGGPMKAARYLCNDLLGKMSAGGEMPLLANPLPHYMGVGLDISGICSTMDVGRDVLECPVVPFGIRYPVLSQDIHLGQDRYCYDFGTSLVTCVPLALLWTDEGADRPEDAAGIAKSFAERLGRTVSLAEDTCLFLCVPDSADDFGLRPLLDAVELRFEARCGIIRRSVAVALANESSISRACNGVSPGASLLVFDAGGGDLSTTPLVARKEPRLAEENCDQIVWERRPPYLCEDDLDVTCLAGIVQSYCRQALGGEYANAGQKDLENIARGLTYSGAASRVLKERKSLHVPLLRNGKPCVGQLRYDDALWHRCCMRWFEAVRHYLRSWHHYGSPLGEHLRKPDAMALILLPEEIHPNVVERFLELFGKHFRGQLVSSLIDKACLAHGAQIGALRLSRELPVFIEWMPDLALDVTRGGLFDQIQLLTAQTLEARAGASLRHNIEDTLDLPPGRPFYDFPLTQGAGSGYPRQILARLESSLFPLTEPMTIRFALKYRYGSNRYSLEATPATKGINSSQKLEFTFQRPGGMADDLKPPRFTTGGYIGNVLRKRLLSMLQRIATPLTESCDALMESRETDNVNPVLRNLRFLLTRDLRECMTLLWRPSKDVPVLDCAEVDTVALQLSRLSGLQRESDFDWPPQILAEEKERLAGWALELLCRMRLNMPRECVDALCAVTPQLLMAQPRRWSMAFRWLLGLSREHANLCGRVFADVFAEAIRTDTQFAQEAACFYVLGFSMWDWPTSVFNLNDQQPDLVKDVCTRFVHSLEHISAEGLPETEKEDLGAWFGGGCAFLLAVLRLRERNRLSPYLARLLRRSARSIRIVDGILAKSGVPVSSPIPVKVQKPENVIRVTDIAYAANAYITGDENCRFVEVSEAFYNETGKESDA